MTIQYTDAGVNLTSHQFEQDCDDIVARAKLAGVTDMLLIGADVAQSKQSLELAKRYGFVSTAGVHPHDAKSVGDDYLQQLSTLLCEPEVVAVGECGLDFNRDFSPRPQQQAVLNEQLNLAQQLNKPVYLHERDAFSAMQAQLERVTVKGVLHCFTGDAQALSFYLNYGLMIGVTGWVCDERRGAQLQALVPHIPDDRLLVETDAPYLIPRTLQPKPKSRRNEPAFISAVVQHIAQLRGQSAAHVAACSQANFARLFAIEDKLP
ncbi:MULTISPECIES: TatD family hydrolase [Pseudoalteromonas]|uniref:Hydrolase TatD n=1 Tax=Pseudoalteromonas amylolytica TaxID=1859457 RepID=A0A1S1MZF5_9GAMM|nr:MULTISPECIES: TatD family hydrolase [Pseudoalteromonas]OHU91808.1 hydrolase TatD [Pseudoalteromonas sp. JW3]OHU93134.1 hydrolase TatD [Pseudoalteromonas amylolytica]